MVYSGITACLGISGKRLPISEVIKIILATVKDKSPGELQTLLVPILREIYTLMDKAEHVDDLRRQVGNLEYLLSEKADWYRKELEAAEQRSREST